MQPPSPPYQGGIKNLVIVESPTKARTISRFLGPGYKVESSYGHIRDLPQKKLGVDTRNDFAPLYVIPDKAKNQVRKLKMMAKEAKKIYLATDEDREGEAISWHLVHALNLKNKITKRIAFHEITRQAILSAIKNPRPINQDLVDAQQARRVLDRLVGYKLSPFLWRKVSRGLSAGRVQSVAVRLICEREKEIQKFKPEEYWSMEALLCGNQEAKEFKASLIKRDGKSIPKLGIKSKEEAEKIQNDLKNAAYKIIKIEKKETAKYAKPAFTTATLQQEAAGRLGFSAKNTMRLAQQLYEGVKLGKNKAQGLITYMRTDSTNMAQKALAEIRTLIKNQYGQEYLPEKAQIYKTKSRLAQEAHEAIRPTEAEITPSQAAPYLDPQQLKLYALIWNRAIACQMLAAKIDATAIDITAGDYLFRANGSIIRFDGYLKVYPSKIQENILPPLSQNEILKLVKLLPEQHFTEALPRFNEASLVRALEKNGIGRPSTYASIISTIQDRGYVEKQDKKFQPKEIGMIVNDLLTAHFPKVVDINFTAKIEEEFDEIANNKKEWVPVIREFYDPFIKNLKAKEMEISKKEITEEATNKKCKKCGKPMVVKLGRFGKFLACTGYPDCKSTEPLGRDKALAEELGAVKCEKCGKPMAIRHGRFGPFLACTGYPDCKNIKNIEKKVGVACPKCETGEIVEKRSKRGRTFFACNQYPKCEFALWSKPTGAKCEKCGSLLVFGKENTEVCSNKECGKN